MSAISTDPLAAENARLRAALDQAAETITALANCIGREDFDGERRAMAKVEEWSRRRAVVAAAFEEAA